MVGGVKPKAGPLSRFPVALLTLLHQNGPNFRFKMTDRIRFGIAQSDQNKRKDWYHGGGMIRKKPKKM